jgi:16S rRNA (guanine1207-N2)-methyltransferase
MNLSLPSQLLERNIELFDSGEWLIINPADSSLGKLLPARNITFLHQYFDIYSQYIGSNDSLTFDSRDIVSASTGFNCTTHIGQQTHIFAPFIIAKDLATDVVIYMPKAKAQLSMLLNMAAALLKEGGRLHLVGETKVGIKSAAKLMTRYGDVQKMDSARHCSLLTCHVTATDTLFSIDDWSIDLDYELKEHQWKIMSLPGVFSHGALDKGTRMLLEKLPSALPHHVLDFACGAGVIGSYLMTVCKTINLSLLDVSALALFCTAHTLHRNQQHGQLIAANNLHGVNGKFNMIVTNPPFHTGVNTDYTVTRDFIATAQQHLFKNSHLYMVANRFLPYPELLAEQFNKVHTVAQDTQFSVYLAHS